MTKRFGHPHDMPIAFVSQLVGIALGIDDKRLGIHRLLRWRRLVHEPAAVGAPAAAEGGDHARA